MNTGISFPAISACCISCPRADRQFGHLQFKVNTTLGRLQPMGARVIVRGRGAGPPQKAYLQARNGSQRHFSLVKVLLWAQSGPRESFHPANRSCRCGIKTRGLHCATHKTSSWPQKVIVEMKEKETKTKDSTEYILDSLSRSTHADIVDASFDRMPAEIYASPEEGVRLISAFIRIKQPELRAAIIKLTT